MGQILEPPQYVSHIKMGQMTYMKLGQVKNESYMKMGQLEKMENGSNPVTTTIRVTYENGSNDIYETGQINTPHKVIRMCSGYH
jgi:hypothetical protein